MKIIFLGSGPAIPVRGKGKNFRSNSSLLVQANGCNILIDATPMIEEQLFKNAIEKIDAVIISHVHSDAVKGLPKLVDLFGRLPVYTLKHNFEIIREIWKDIDIEEHIIKPEEKFEICGVRFTPFRVIHAEPFPTGNKYPCLGFRFNGVLYAEDMEAVPPESEKYFEDADTLIIDAAMYFNRKIRGHMNTEQALQLVKKYKPKRAILTQIGKTYPDHYKACKRIEDYCKLKGIHSKVELAYDGLVVDELLEINLQLKRQKKALSKHKNKEIKKLKRKDTAKEDIRSIAKDPVKLAEYKRTAIYLTKPHAELLYNNEKKLIIKSEKSKNMLDRNIYFIDDDFCYGIIRLTNVKEISLKDFEELKTRHRISDAERKEWWGDKDILYAYEFEWVEHFPEPRPIVVPEKVQIFTESWKFQDKIKNSEDYKFHRTLELIQDIYNYNPHNMENGMLADDFRLAVAYYSKILQGKKIKFTKEQIIKLATLILKEIVRRKRAGKMKWTANPKGKSEAYQKLWNEVELNKEEREVLTTKMLSEAGHTGSVLSKILPELDSKLVVKDFVSLVGSTVEKGEGNDVDILIRLDDLDFIKRAVYTLFRKKLDKLGIKKDVHVFFEPSGPADSYIPLFDLKLEIRKPFKKIEMRELDLSEIPLPYLPQKPYGSAYNSVEELLGKAKDDTTYFVEKKFNGFHASIIKKDDDIKVFSEQKKDITSAFKTLVEDIRKLSDKDFYVDGELVPYDKEGKALGRRPLMKFIGAVESGKSVDDSNIKLHIWDIIYYDGKDLRSLPLKERKEYLKKLKFTNRITDTPYRLVKGREDLRKAVEWASALPSSEGAVIKEADAHYTFDEKSRAWLKYHKLYDIDCVVLQQNKTKEQGVYNYKIGVYVTDEQAKKINPDRLTEFNGKKALDLKNTFNTTEIFKPGDIISVEIEDIWRHETPKGIYYSIHKPKIRHITEKKETSPLSDLDNLVCSIGSKVVKEQEVVIERNSKLPEESTNDTEDSEGGTRSEAARIFFEENWHNLYPKSGKGEYIFHEHWRGLSEQEAKTLDHRGLLIQGEHSVHGDLRLSNNGTLHGFTVFEGSTKDIPVKEGSKLVYMAQHKGETKFEKLEVAPKLEQPRSWLLVARDKPYLSPPKGTGSTSNKWAKFFALDWGSYELGVIRKHSREYFLHGNKMKGRVLITYAPVGEERRWLIDFPVDQTPYAESHDLNEVMAELKQKKQKWLIWCKPGMKPQKIKVF